MNETKYAKDRKKIPDAQRDSPKIQVVKYGRTFYRIFVGQAR